MTSHTGSDFAPCHRHGPVADDANRAEIAAQDFDLEHASPTLSIDRLRRLRLVAARFGRIVLVATASATACCLLGACGRTTNVAPPTNTIASDASGTVATSNTDATPTTANTDTAATDPTATGTPNIDTIGAGTSAAVQDNDMRGTITWPDGTALANVRIEFFVTQDSGPQDTPTTDSNGNYDLSGGATYPQLYGDAYIALDNTDPNFNSGQPCVLPLTAGGTNYTVQPASTVNWQVVAVNCTGAAPLPDNIAGLIQSPIPGTATWQEAEQYANSQ